MTTTRRARPLRGGRRSPLATLSRWASAVLLGVAVVGVLVFSVGTFTGWLLVQTVPTGSMEPTIHRGSAIVVDPIGVDDVRVGDVIVFAAPETQRMTVHRVTAVERGDDGRPVFTTKGDANNGPDPWRLQIDDDHLHRVRLAVPHLGGLLLAMSALTTRIVLTAAGAALVLWYGVTYLLRRPGEPARDAHADASATWDGALGRLAGDDEPLLDDPPALAPPAVAPAAVDAAADPASVEPLRRLLAEIEPASADPTGAGAPTEDRQREKAGLALSATAPVVVIAVVLGLAWVPLRSASAAFTGTTAAAAGYSTATVATKTNVGCAWGSATAVTVSWTNPNALDTARVLSAASPGGATTTVATAGAGATNATWAPPSPLTTVRYLSTQAVSGTWTSPTSPEMATNYCRGAVRLVAGAGNAGLAGDGGPATAASLDTPYETAEAPDGRIFVADSGNDRIRVVSTTGVISTFAGTGASTACSYTGPVSGLRLSAPRGLTVDAAGNLYVADTGANCVRKIDTAGNVTRVAGGGTTTTCATTVAATSLSLANPSGLALAPDGSLVVADSGRNCVRRISAGTASHVAGGGGTMSCGTTTATAVSLSNPIGVAVDASGSVFVADSGRACVRQVTGTSVSRVAGGGSSNSCTTATTASTVSLSSPEGVAVAADGSVAVADTRCVRRVSGTVVSPLAFTSSNTSTGDNGPALAATARTPSGLTFLADGDLLVADRATSNGSSDIRRIELS